MTNLNIFIPYNLDYTIINCKYIYIYSKNTDICFILNINKSNLLINNNTIILLKIHNKSNLFNLELTNFLFSLDNFFFLKIKFTGKGFKWKKKQNNLFLFFNRAHKCFFINKNSIFLKLSKNKLILLKNNCTSLKNDSMLLSSIRGSNIFTKRGIRCSRQLIYKKRGKAGAK